MNNNRECADYFRRQRGYDRCFLEMRKKWESYGKVSGRIILADATEEEKRALGGILGKSFYDGEIRFTMREFQEALQKTRFASVTLHDLLEQYFGQPLRTNQEKTAAKKAKQEANKTAVDRMWDRQSTSRQRTEEDEAVSALVKARRNTEQKKKELEEKNAKGL